MTCTQPGYGGTVQDGYCDICGCGQPTGKGPIMGCEPNARALARLTPGEDRRIELVDMTNAIRPRTLT